jgi:hypothetical protein
MTITINPDQIKLEEGRPYIGTRWIMTNNWCEDGLLVEYKGDCLLIGEYLDMETIIKLIGDVQIELSTTELSAIDKEVADNAGPFNKDVRHFTDSYGDPSSDTNSYSGSQREVITWTNTITGVKFQQKCCPEPLNKERLIESKIKCKLHTLACKKLKEIWVEQNMAAIKEALLPLPEKMEVVEVIEKANANEIPQKIIRSWLVSLTPIQWAKFAGDTKYRYSVFDTEENKPLEKLASLSGMKSYDFVEYAIVFFATGKNDWVALEKDVNQKAEAITAAAKKPKLKLRG